MMRPVPLAVMVLMALLVVSCKGGGSSPVQPPETDQTAGSLAAATAYQHCLLGFWDVCVDADHESFEVIPQRVVAGHFNIVRPVETTWKKSYLTIEHIYPEPPDAVRVYLQLRHPYPENLNFSAFDVRGIFISQGDFTFPVTGAKVAIGDDVPKMLEPDGYTRIFNPVNYPPDGPVPFLLKYTRGQLATGWLLTSTVNPYIAFNKDAPRRAFLPSHYEYRDVFIHVPSGPFHFGYALDASWAQVLEPITDPYKQFPPEANSQEAYRIEVLTGRELTPSPGSTTLIGVVVYDREGLDTIQSVVIEAPQLFQGLKTLSYAEPTNEGAYLFTGTLTNALGAGYGEYNILVRVTDTRLDPSLGVVEAWDLHKIRIKHGWARTFPARVIGDNASGYAQDVAVDGSGDIYLTGWFEQKGDFDPGPCTDWHETSSYIDKNAFLVRYSPLGQYQRGLTWGGEGRDIGYRVDLDDSGNIYVMGTFYGTTDFDPGPSVAHF